MCASVTPRPRFTCFISMFVRPAGWKISTPRSRKMRSSSFNITENPDTKRVILEAENTLTGQITQTEVDMAVLAIGMVPNTAEAPPPLDTPLDEFGFIAPDTGKGVIGAGTTMRPFDVSASVQDATGAALKAINQGRGR